MIKASISLQKLRRKIYIKAKTDKYGVVSAGGGGVGGYINPKAALAR